jgi:type III pantothenate kinase
MNRLIIDAGNTRSKIAVFNESTIIYKESLPAISLLELQQLIIRFSPVATIVSSVTHLEPEVMAFIGLLPNSLLLNESTDLPVTNNYLTPETLGSDRIANATASWMLFKSNSLVIDTGTCLKMDFITADGNYLGGSISPGLQMRYNALNHFTYQLPFLNPVHEAQLTGNTTETSIHSGIINGMSAEINGMIQQYENKYDNLKLIVTGGDSSYFLNHLKKPIFASPELTLNGLHYILLHNYPQ